jgi:rhodanese-related sulfurtransferase
VASQVNTAPISSDGPEISREELRSRLKSASLTIVDVLPAESYAAGHIPGAISLPLESLASQARELLPDPTAEIAVYCGKFTWQLGEQAVALLHELGYSKVRDYRGGISDWVESGEPLESAAGAAWEPQPSTEPGGPQLVASPDGHAGRGPARVSRQDRWNDSFLAFIERLSTFQLFLVWIGTVLLSGFGYWLCALIGEHGLIEAGSPVGADLKGLSSALYFSFVTATSLGYGDVIPIGIARAIAVGESVTALLVFGAVVAKFVSHRQDELVREIYRVTFDERLDRVQSNLHVVISELLSITSICETPAMPLQRVATRLDSAALLFLAELRTTHDLLYQPRLLVEEGVLASILANLASALDVLTELLTCLPTEFTRSQPLQIALGNVTRLAEDICGNCVPHAYTPRLVFWMDRIQTTARRIH